MHFLKRSFLAKITTSAIATRLSRLSSLAFNNRWTSAGLVFSALASLAPAAGPGLGNLTYSSAENRTRISIVNDSNPAGSGGSGDGHGNVCMFDGYLMTIYASDGGGSNAGFAFWNVSNPRSPVRVANHRPSNSKLREPHGYGFTTGYGGRYYFIGQSTSGIQIWDFTNINAPTLVRDIILTGANSSDYGGVWWASVQAPYVYVAGGDRGLYIVDITNPANPVQVRRDNAAIGLSRCNQVHAVGNLLIAGRVEEGTGISLLDISDPMNPVLRFSTASNLPIPYSSIFTDGKLFFASKGSNGGAGNPTRGVYAYSVNFDANNQPNGLTYLDSAGSGLGDGGYLSYQDGFVFAGFSQRFAKFDARVATNITQIFSMATGISGEDIDFATVIGNVVFAGQDHGNGSGIVPHQTERDTTGPSVNFVSPRNNSVRQDVRSRVGLTFSDAVDFRSLTTATFIVRPVGGNALPGKYSLSNERIVNFAPNAPLAANTTYEVVVTAGGIKDSAGNGGPTQFTSRFSTGTAIGNTALDVCNAGTDTPANVGASVSFNATLCSPGSGGVTYSWNFGDNTPPTAFSGSNTATHTYSTPGHYTVIVNVRDSSGATDSSTRRQTVSHPVTATKPTTSSTIVHDSGRNRVFVVNSDGGTVASLNAASPFAKLWEVQTGKNPRSLALTAPNGDLWVTNQDDSNLRVLNGGTGATIATIALPRASRPYGIAFNPAGTFAFVSLESSGQLVKISTSTRAVVGTVNVGPRPRGVAVSSDGARVFVTRFTSPQSGGGEVREISANAFTLSRTFVVSEDVTTTSSESNGPGIPNYLAAITITPDGRGAWVPSKKDNVFRGTGSASDGDELTFDSTVRTIVSKLDLISNNEVFSLRRDLNNSDLANAVAFNARGDYAFVSAQGNNHIEVYDALSHTTIGSIDNVGLAPQGVVVVGNLLFVQNLLSRNVAIYDIGTAGGSNSFTRVGAVTTQATELLSAQLLEGKRIFHNSADPRMSLESYISCASCHQDGDSDARVWDFTQRGEGLRNTVDLLGRAGVLQQGRVHWSGNFDEIQDFENDIRNAFEGTGFMSDTNFNATRDPLGVTKAGRSPQLDALSAYVSSLTAAHPSPFRNADGTMTADAIAGRALFESAAVGCAVCHSGPQKTDSARGILHDVGTITAASGRRNSQTLTGLDTPTVNGVWETGPYLHDGSATTLLDVITTRNPANRHGATSQLSATQRNQLVAYMQQLESEVSSPNPDPNPNPGGAIVSGATYSLVARHSGKVLGINGGSTTDGATVVQQTNTNAASQRFVVTEVGTGFYRISPVSNPTRALDVNNASTTDGAAIIQWTYGGGSNQQWQLISLPGGFFQIRSRLSGKVMDVTSAATTDGAAIVQWTAGTGTNQQFTFVRQ